MQTLSMRGPWPLVTGFTVRVYYCACMAPGRWSQVLLDVYTIPRLLSKLQMIFYSERTLFGY